MKGKACFALVALLVAGCGAFHYTERVRVTDPGKLLDPEVASLAQGSKITYRYITGNYQETGEFTGVSDSLLATTRKPANSPGFPIHS